MDFFLKFLALTPSPYNHDIKVKLLHLLYSNFLKAAFVIIFISTFLTYTLYSTTDHTLLLSWFVAVIVITIFRITDTLLYLRDQQKHSYSYWQQHFAIGVIISALLWAVVPLLFFDSENHAKNFFIAFVILGMTAGAGASLVANLRLTHIYLYLLMAPLFYTFLHHDLLIYTSAAMMTVLYVPIVSISARQFHATLVETYHTIDLYHKTKDALFANEKRFRMMFEQAPIGIFYYDDDLTIMECNAELGKILNAPKEQLVGLNLNNLPDARPLNAMRQFLSGAKTAIYEGSYHSAIANLELSVKIQMTPLVDEQGETRGGLCMFEDKTKEHTALLEAEYLSLHDPLTTLPNRKLLKERMEQTSSRQKREPAFSALLFLDLDHFKQINDSLGHNIGDMILIETAKRLKATLRESDTLSRLGGDEFVILLPQLSDSREQAMHYAYEVAQKVHLNMNVPFEVERHQLFSSTSIGISLFGDDSTESDEILRQADMAMYQSKNDGRKRTSFYNIEMDREMQHYIEIKKSLSQAIQRHEFTLYFQPILKINSNQTIAGETLLRWKHNGNFISTIEFINIAEESSLINEIGKWVITETCQQIQKWKALDLFKLEYLTINISARQLLEEGFSSFLLQQLADYNVAHQLLKLEITETALITNFDKAQNVIHGLNDKGIDFIIDDFGTGYSSLSYLKELPFSALKIDKTFVRDILIDHQDEKLIRAIIDTAEQFDYQIIAEGIEKEAQRLLLEKIKPTLYYQGYLASKPLSAKEFERYLNKI